MIFRIKHRSKNCNDTDNSKSNYLNSFYSLETREDLQTNISSRYKLCSNSTSKIDYQNNYETKNKKHLKEITEVEDSYLNKSKKKVFSGIKYVYDTCEIL